MDIALSKDLLLLHFFHVGGFILQCYLIMESDKLDQLELNAIKVAFKMVFGNYTGKNMHIVY